MRSRHAGVLALAVGVLAVAPAVSQAEFHLTKIREVSGGSGAPDSAYVELQMTAGGQSQFENHEIQIYDGSGNIEGTCPLVNVAQSASQRTILVGDTGVAQRDVTCDLSENLASLVLGNGAVCFADASPPDCVSWNVDGSTTPIAGLPAPGAGTPFQGSGGNGVPYGQALRRNSAAGCPTLLEEVDDTNSSASDFALAGYSPTPNGAVPAEQACPANGKTANKKKGKCKRKRKPGRAREAKKKCKKKRR